MAEERHFQREETIKDAETYADEGREGFLGVPRLDQIGIEDLRAIDEELVGAIEMSSDLEDARTRLARLLERRESYFHSEHCTVEGLERVNALSCTLVLRNLISRRNEMIAGCSTLRVIFHVVRKFEEVPPAFRSLFFDFLHIVRGSTGKSGIYKEEAPPFLEFEGHEAARRRSDYLDALAGRCIKRIESYPSGLDRDVIERRAENRRLVLDVLGGKEDDWRDYRWHLRNVLREVETISGIIDLTSSERDAIRLAVDNGIPFGITPYYISLMDREPSRRRDHAIRAQVIPPIEYVESMVAFKDQRKVAFDFMKEGQTSPLGLVTRRYPMIAIFKPYNTCAQICVYCQRNWEIDGVLSPKALASPEDMDEAIKWFESHPAVSEVLITGGDPALLSDGMHRDILDRFASMAHIQRIRIGTRLPVVLPMRFTEKYLGILESIHDPPSRELCIVTHFEHPYEVTPEASEVIGNIRRGGMMVYNQQVFTFENCRRFETVALRCALKRIGIDPYYTFNAKGKEETSWYRVPIARILQEVKEEARLIPGLSRTDEPVFNIPALGKNHLRAWQHHDLIMISPEGERVYEFHPWEKNIALAPTYVYRDVPIAEFLQRLAARGEDVDEYSSIWYYF
ncbi:MAG: KamA family radical SAM protein [Euryarchaeota archaeon]|nr:KamA family radical SAM protein [Euryarchaeota archaeon]